MPVPKLRSMDAFKTKMEGKEYVCLKDIEGVVDDIIVLSQQAFFVAAMLDGVKEVIDIQSEFAKYFQGQVLYSDDIKSLIKDLDERGILYTKNYEDMKKKIEDDFKNSSIRKSFLADRSFPSDAGKLREMIFSLFDSDKGPKIRPSGKKELNMKGCISPHIDYTRGGFSYAHIYKRIAENVPRKTFVILGVAHASPPCPFILTEKDFETPFGTVPVNREITGKLLSAFNGSLTEFEIVHRAEHSIELQVVFLKALLDYDFNVVPILCSSVPDKNDQQVNSFIEKLGECLDSETMVISGADLAHVGPRFGDPFPISQRLLDWMGSEDQKSIEHIKTCDADGFWDSVVYDGNRRKVCGLTSIYTFLKLLKKGKGELLDYSYAPDPAGGIVSFASLSF